VYERLEVAVGDRPTIFGPDVLYCDLRDLGVRPLIICDISERMPFEGDQFKEIHGMHCLEHISHLKTDAVLREWNRILRPGGLLRIDVPNLRYWATRIVNDLRDQEAVVHLYGNQDYGDLNVHRTGFTDSLLELAYLKAGFENVVVKDVGGALCGWGYKE
jgi:predicted SAM-dependent methyltransferase